jgi:hypothetical protein
MKRYLSLLLLVGVILVAGCSSQSAVIPVERNADIVIPGAFPASGFQANASFFATPGIPPYFIPFNMTLGELGLTNEDALNVLIGGSIVNAACPFDVDVPEWDEWLLRTTMDVDVPEWDEWLLNITQEVDVPEWDEWLLNDPIDVDVPEWDEWLTRLGNMPQYRSADWMDWAVHGPYQIVDVDVPEWDEWLTSLRIGQIACSYDIWLHLSSPVQ